MFKAGDTVRIPEDFSVFEGTVERNILMNQMGGQILEVKEGEYTFKDHQRVRVYDESRNNSWIWEPKFLELVPKNRFKYYIKGNK